MKILFYDGNLSEINNKAIPKNAYLVFETVDAADGPLGNIVKLSYIKDCLSNDTYVLTNSLAALSHEFGWDEEENHTNIYIWKDNENDFIRIDKLTRAEIKEDSNIEEMYYKGEF